MSKKQFLILLGIWVMAFLFLGFPAAWDKAFALLTGFLIVIMAFRISRSGSNIEANVNVRTNSTNNLPYIEHKTDTKNPSMSSSSPIKVQEPISNSGNDFIRTDATIS